MPDPAAPPAPTDDSSDPASDRGDGDDRSSPATSSTEASTGASSTGAGSGDAEAKKKKTVKKIVKKVPVATKAVPTDQSRASGARPAPPTMRTEASRTAVPLAKADDHSALPPPPRTTAPATRRPPPPDPPLASGDEVRRVGPVTRRRLGRLRARKVRRILRHVEVWSVLKVSIVFYFCLWLVLLVSGAVIWKVATQAGLIDNVENFLQESGFDEVDFDGETMFRAWASGGFIMVFASTGFTVLLAVLFNLISDLMGGVRFTVIELETIRRRKPNRSRRGAARPSNRP